MIKQWIKRVIAVITAFVNSDGLKNFLFNVVALIKLAVLTIANAIGRLVITIYSFIKSDRFKHGVRCVRVFVTRIYKKCVEGIKWAANGKWLKKVLTPILNLFNRCLPKPGQQKIAILSIFIIAILLVLLIPASEQPSIPAPVPTQTTIKPEGKPPVISTSKSEMPNFSEIPAGRERKAAFFGYFLSIINDHNQTIQKNRKKLISWLKNKDNIGSKDANEINQIATRYKVNNFDISSDKSWNQLLSRVDVVPPSLALAQSANESAWGTSRFARKANNFFGQWCFKRGCGLVPKKRDANKTHEVAAFKSPQESVQKYIRNLNSNSAYKPLREIRAKLRKSNKPVTGHALAAGLIRYSERGEDYISELREMIEYNKLTQHDKY